MDQKIRKPEKLSVRRKRIRLVNEHAGPADDDRLPLPACDCDGQHTSTCYGAHVCGEVSAEVDPCFIAWG